MKRILALSALALLGLSSILSAQSSDIIAVADAASVSGFTRQVPIASGASDYKPFSRIAIEGGLSPLGGQVQITTNINRHLNMRSGRNMFAYSTNFTTSGVTANARLDLSSSAASADFYPFRKGFRLSAGVLFLNGNQLKASAPIAGGTSFTLNGNTFYSATANSSTGATPVNGTGSLSLNHTEPALTLTTGWGNTIPRKGGHWSFPFEIGTALTGAPDVKANLTGWVCYDQAQTQCTNLANTSDPVAIQVHDDLNAQIATWKKDLEPLKTYPIISFGVAYSFRVR